MAACALSDDGHYTFMDHRQSRQASVIPRHAIPGQPVPDAAPGQPVLHAPFMDPSAAYQNRAYPCSFTLTRRLYREVAAVNREDLHQVFHQSRHHGWSVWIEDDTRPVAALSRDVPALCANRQLALAEDVCDGRLMALAHNSVVEGREWRGHYYEHPPGMPDQLAWVAWGATSTSSLPPFTAAGNRLHVAAEDRAAATGGVLTNLTVVPCASLADAVHISEHLVLDRDTLYLRDWS